MSTIILEAKKLMGFEWKMLNRWQIQRNESALARFLFKNKNKTSTLCASILHLKTHSIAKGWAIMRTLWYFIYIEQMKKRIITSPHQSHSTRNTFGLFWFGLLCWQDIWIDIISCKKNAVTQRSSCVKFKMWSAIDQT